MLHDYTPLGTALGPEAYVAAVEAIIASRGPNPTA